MSEMSQVRSFVEAMKYTQQGSECARKGDGCFPFVTISRETGAGGNSVAAAIVKRLETKGGVLFSGWQKFNQELCTKVAEDTSLNVHLKALIDTEYRSELMDYLNEVIVGTAPQYAVHKKMFELIRTLALYGKVIIVGRGGMCLTRELPLGVHLRLVAPKEVRIEKIKKMFSYTETQAKDYIQKQDKGRETFVRTYFNKNIADPLLYDAVWNTGTVSYEDIASSAVELLERRVRIHQAVTAKAG